MDSALLEVERVRSSRESEDEVLRLGSRCLEDEEEGLMADEVSLVFLCWAGGPSLKIWTVSVAEETQRSDDVVLKDML